MLRIFIFLLLFLTACGANPAFSPLPAEVTSELIAVEPPAAAMQPKLFTPRASAIAPEDDAVPLKKFVSFKAHEGRINALVVSRDGTTAYSGGDDGIVLESRRPTDAKSIQTRVALRGNKPILALSLSSDDRYLAIAQVSSVVVFDTRQRKLVFKLTKVLGSIPVLTWDPLGELLAVGRSNGDVYVWNIGNREMPNAPSAGRDSHRALELYRGASAPVTSIAFHPLGRAMFVGHRNPNIYLWQLIRTQREMQLQTGEFADDKQRTARKKQTIDTTSKRVEDLWMRPDGELMVVAAEDGALHRVKIRGAKLLAKLDGSKSQLTSVTGLPLAQAMKPSGQRSAQYLVASAARDHQIRFWCFVEDEEMAAETAAFSEPIVVLRSGTEAPLLWAGQKSGNLLSFDAHEFMRSPLFSNKLSRCQRVSARTQRLN